MGIIYVNPGSQLLYTEERNTSLIESLAQYLLLRKGEASFYGNAGIDWYGIEQNRADIDYELSTALSVFEPFFQELEYQWSNVNSVLIITISAVFKDTTEQEFTLERKL